MSSDKMYFTKEEREFLTERLEIEDLTKAVDRFAELMVMEKVDPLKLQEYLKAIMKRVK